MAEHRPTVGTLVNPDHVHEDSDVSIRGLALFLAGLTVTLIIVGAIVVWLFDVFLAESERDDKAPSPLAATAATPTPLLQIAERRDLKLLRDRQNRLLHQATWVDREQDIARIPIEEAIELTIEHGLPNWPPAQEAQP